ncbi:MAG: cell division protein FtsA [Mediterranea sp.]|jgi:cell division protein FtsA|nr:cell division protein FtsA [Mediterranea sp.]
MATTEFIAAIELGSSKIAGAAGKRNSDGSLQILAYVQEDSAPFIRKGVIFNVDKATQSLIAILQKLEKELKCSVSKVYVGIGGQSLRTVPGIVTRDLNEETIITEELVSAIGDENLAAPPAGMDILEVSPQEYKVEKNLQANPVGLLGSHIEGRFQNIVARSSVKKNLEYCFHQAKIEVAELIVAPIATAKALLSESERRAGCALIDFGADTTTLAVYKNDILRYLAVLPLGGNNITRDITTLNIEEEEAELLKKKYGDVLYEEDANQEPSFCEPADGGRPIALSDLNDIVEARAKEMVENVFNLLKLSGYEEKLSAGIVLTGGTSNLKNLDEMVRKHQKSMKLRVAKLPKDPVRANSDALKGDGTQNTLFGLLLSGDQNCCRPEERTTETPENTPIASPTSPDAQKAHDIFANDEELEAERKRLKEKKQKEDEEEAERRRLQKLKDKEEKEKAKQLKEQAKKHKTNPFVRLMGNFFDDESSKLEDDKD